MTTPRFLIAVTLCSLALSAQADSLPVLKAALQRLQGESPLKGQVVVKSRISDCFVREGMLRTVAERG